MGLEPFSKVGPMGRQKNGFINNASPGGDPSGEARHLFRGVIKPLPRGLSDQAQHCLRTAVGLG